QQIVDWQGGRGALPGSLQHFPRNVDAGNAARVADKGAKFDRRGAAATAHIDDTFAASRRGTLKQRPLRRRECDIHGLLEAGPVAPAEAIPESELIERIGCGGHWRPHCFRVVATDAGSYHGARCCVMGVGRWRNSSSTKGNEQLCMRLSAKGA